MIPLKVPLFIIASIFLCSCGEKEQIAKITAPIITEETEFEDDPVIQVVKVEPVPDVEPEPIKKVKLEEKKNTSFVEQMLQGKTSFIYGNSMTLRNIAKSPKHYIFYFTGEWSAHCKENLPKLKKYYTEELKNNPDVELVMVSADEPSWITKWGVNEGFEWPLLVGETLSDVPMLSKNAERYAYYFMMMDKDGASLQTTSLDECIEIVNQNR